MEVYNINKLHHEQLISSRNGEIFSKSAVLTELLCCRKIFVHHEILSPMKRASSPHSHTMREEIIFVLNGCPTAHLGTQVIQLQPGDFIGFQPGTKELHFIENTTDEEVRFLVICSQEESDKIVFDA